MTKGLGWTCTNTLSLDRPFCPLGRCGLDLTRPHVVDRATSTGKIIYRRFVNVMQELCKIIENVI